MIHYVPCPRCRENGRDRSGDNLVMFSEHNGYCFNCKYCVFPKHYVPRGLKENVNAREKALRPSDYTREIPSSALRWLLQFGLPYSHWRESIGYSPKEQRLVFSVSQESGDLAFSIGRFISTGNIPQPGTSYEREPRKWYVWGDSHKHCAVYGTHKDDRGGPIVLVEDLISAHKCAAAGFTSVPLFGTEVHPAHMYYLINSDKPVVLWLDKDQEQLVKRKAMRLESLLNRSVRVVTTERDPKMLSFKEINDKLSG